MTDPVGQWPETLSSRMHDLLRVATAPAPLAPLGPPAATQAQEEHPEREVPAADRPPTNDEPIV